MIKIGVIGLGFRAAGVLDAMLKFKGEIEVVSVCDPDGGTPRQRLRDLGLDDTKVRFFDDADAMLDQTEPDGVIIGTRCPLHPHFGVKVLKRGIHLYMEKPLSITLEGLKQLKEAYAGSKSKVLVSLPLRLTPLAVLAKEIIDSGKIGTVEHIQACANIAYGDVYYHSWYRDETLTGGLFLQKSVHDFDYINHISSLNPVMVCAMKSKQIFKGNKEAGQTCDDCADVRTCPQSPFAREFLRDQHNYGNECCFAKDTGNEDSGSAIVLYESGAHLSYSQNFFCRNSAAKRGARFFGYKGTLEFDWVTNRMVVHNHDCNRTDTYQYNVDKPAHGGGDVALALNFINMLKYDEPAIATIEDAFQANLLCLKAKESAEKKQFVPVVW